MIRVGIADDHAIVREALVTAISRTHDMVVSAQARDGVEAVETARSIEMDVLLLDLRMPRKSGLAALEEILAQDSPPKVIIFSSFDSAEEINAAIDLGASGYLLKIARSREILDAIRSVHAGAIALGDTVAEKLITSSSPPPEISKSFTLLTEREREVLGVLSEGLSNPQIAEKLGVSTGTAKTHVASIIRKLEAKSRTDAVVRAAQAGLLEI